MTDGRNALLQLKQKPASEMEPFFYFSGLKIVKSYIFNDLPYCLLFFNAFF